MPHISSPELNPRGTGRWDNAAALALERIRGRGQALTFRCAFRTQNKAVAALLPALTEEERGGGSKMVGYYSIGLML